MIRATKREMFGILTECGFRCWADLKDGWEAIHSSGMEIKASMYPNGESWSLKVRSPGVFWAWGWRPLAAESVRDLIDKITESLGDKAPLVMEPVTERER